MIKKSQEELLRRTQELAKVGGWELKLDDMSLSWTEEVYKIHELPTDERPKLEDGINFYAEEARPTISKAVNDAIEVGTPWDLELPFVTAKGNSKWVRAIGYPERKNDKTVRLSGVIQDITEHTHIQLALKESNRRFQMVVEGSGAGIWDWMNVKEDNEWWSPKFYELLGYDDKEIRSSLENFQKLVHPSDLQHTFEALENHFKGLAPFEVEYRLKTKSGEYKWFLGTGQAQRDDESNPTRMVGSIIDIDKRKKSELEIVHKNEELEYKNKELEQFTYIASHDLQEPLRTVTGMMKLLEKEYGKHFDDTGKKGLRFIEEATNRMSKLIKGLLDYSRIGRDKEIVMVDCNKLVAEIREDLALTISKAEATFKIEKLPVIHGYETELRQLFQNLISNAIKFRTKGSAPHIKISGSKKNDFWQFAVEDNGIGITERHQEKVFNIFQRLHNRNIYEGSGIGLSHSRKIVNSLGGKIWVESEPTKGSTFHFTIKTELV